MIDKKEIELFLKEIKEKINFFGVVFRPRDKNLESLAALDITPFKRVEYLLNLQAENYNSGPNKDTYDVIKPDYYEFGIQIKGKDVYIKISRGLINKPVDCMSFHIAEHPMKYPLKKKHHEMKRKNFSATLYQQC